MKYYASPPIVVLALTPFLLLSQPNATTSLAAQPPGRRTAAVGTELAVDRSLDPVLGELERGDFKAARHALEKTDGRQRSIERPIAELVVYLVTLDGHRAAGVLDEVQRTDPLSAQRCRQADLSTTIASLQHKRAPLEKEMVGDALTRLAIAFPNNRFPRAAVVAYVAKVLKRDPTHVTADLESERRRAADAAATRERLEKLERNLSFTQVQVAGLNRQAKDLLRSVGVLQAGATAFNERLVVDENQMADLKQKVNSVVDKLVARQTQLEQLIEQRDQRVMTMIESARSELRNVGGTVAEQRAALNSLAQRYPTLMAGGPQTPGAVASDVARLGADARTPATFARILGYAANVFSIGGTVGRVTINVLGILSTIASLLA